MKNLLATIIVCVLAAGGCVASASPSPSEPAASPSASAATIATPPAEPTLGASPPGAAASQSLAPSPAQTPTPRPSPPPSAAARPSAPTSASWSHVGSMPAASGEEHIGAIAFDRGYIVWGYASQQPMALVAWYSPDGVTWTRSDLAKTITGCDGAKAADIAYASIAVTDGKTAALFASLGLPGTGACPGASKAVALSTSDGRTWRRSEVGPSGRSFGPAAAWRAAGGWDALIADSGGTGLWHSADLVTWKRLSTVPASSDLMESRGAASGSTRVVATTGRETDGAILVSDGGMSWRSVASLPNDHVVGGVLAPAIPGTPWLVEVGSNSSSEDPATLLTSTDLETWRTATIPETWATVVALPWGWEAVGVVPYDCLGGNCPPGPASVLYRSVDGVHWTTWGEVPRDIPAGGAVTWPPEFLVAGNGAGQAAPLWRLTTG